MTRARKLITMPLGFAMGIALVMALSMQHNAPGQDKVPEKAPALPVAPVPPKEATKDAPKDDGKGVEWVGKDDPKQPPKRLIPPIETLNPKPADPKPAAPKTDEKKVEPKKTAAPPSVPKAAVLDETPTSNLSSQGASVPSKVTGLEITPDKVTIPSSKRFQIVTAKAQGKVKWMVFNQGKQPVEWLQLPGTKSIQVFPNYGVDDVITVYAYSAVGNEPTDPVRSVITVGKDPERKNPPPGEVENPKDDVPPPNPKDPPVVGTTLHMTIITDEGLPAMNKALADLVASKDLRAGVENRGHKLWIWDQKKDIAKIKDKGFDEYLRKIGKIPLYIIQDDTGSVVDSGPLPTTLVSVMSKIDAIAPSPPPAARREGDAKKE